jgi:hypothetical protein
MGFIEFVKQKNEQIAQLCKLQDPCHFLVTPQSNDVKALEVMVETSEQY